MLFRWLCLFRWSLDVVPDCRPLLTPQVILAAISHTVFNRYLFLHPTWCQCNCILRVDVDEKNPGSLLCSGGRKNLYKKVSLLCFVYPVYVLLTHLMCVLCLPYSRFLTLSYVHIHTHSHIFRWPHVPLAFFHLVLADFGL